MKLLTLIVLCSVLVGCSDRVAETSRPKLYSVTFAVVLLPDTVLSEFGGTFAEGKGYNFVSIEDRSRLASYILENPAKFPTVRRDGDWIPLVKTGGESTMRLSGASAAKAFSLDTSGVRLDRFDVGITVAAEDSTGQIGCNWLCQYEVTLAKPLGGSSTHGGDRPGGYALRSDKPDMSPFFNFNGKTLWMIVGLSRLPY